MRSHFLELEGFAQQRRSSEYDYAQSYSTLLAAPRWIAVGGWEEGLLALICVDLTR